MTATFASAFVAVAVAQDAREWRDAKGKTILTQDRQKLVGKLLLEENDAPKKVRVEMDGRTFNFPLAQLSAADQKYVKSERAKKKETQKTNSDDSKPANSKPTTAKEGVKRALLIGVNDYQEFADVQYAVADVEAIRDQLLNLEFQSKNIVVLKSQGDSKTRPTQANLRRQIAAFLESAQENDFLFIYFSGHAFQTRGAARFAPENAVATQDAARRFSFGAALLCFPALRTLAATAVERSSFPAATAAKSSVTRPTRTTPKGSGRLRLGTVRRVAGRRRRVPRRVAKNASPSGGSRSARIRSASTPESPPKTRNRRLDAPTPTEIRRRRPDSATLSLG
ncbi:MAG: caspase family protein [Thermoguttaceae bacterium]|nr:caspase family protein [Thermoguttaceae bacterium]